METRELTKIEVPYPDAGKLELKISVGACRLRVKPSESAGATAAWITGTYDDPSGGLASKIMDKGYGSVKITQQSSLSAFKTPFSGAPRMELELNRTKPFALNVETGASDSVFDLGALPLTRLVIKKGAGKCEVDFPAPNPVEMEEIDIDAGAVTLTMRNLANANFVKMTMDGGAATYNFDFSGELRRDASVKMNAGVSTLKMRIPAATAAKITPGSVLGSLDIGDGLTKKEGAFWTEAAVAGNSPVLSISASVALGALSLHVI